MLSILKSVLLVVMRILYFGYAMRGLTRILIFSCVRTAIEVVLTERWDGSLTDVRSY